MVSSTEAPPRPGRMGETTGIGPSAAPGDRGTSLPNNETISSRPPPPPQQPFGGGSHPEEEEYEEYVEVQWCCCGGDDDEDEETPQPATATNSDGSPAQRIREDGSEAPGTTPEVEDKPKKKKKLRRKAKPPAPKVGGWIESPSAKEETVQPTEFDAAEGGFQERKITSNEKRNSAAGMEETGNSKPPLSRRRISVSNAPTSKLTSGAPRLTSSRGSSSQASFPTMTGSDSEMNSIPGLAESTVSIGSQRSRGSRSGIITSSFGGSGVSANNHSGSLRAHGAPGTGLSNEFSTGTVTASDTFINPLSPPVLNAGEGQSPAKQLVDF